MPRLGIVYGTAYTRAVLVWPDGRMVVLAFDGGFELSSAVHHTPGSTVLVGAAAWRQARTDPDGFLDSPLRAGTGQVHLAGTDVQVVDLVAATLRQVAAEAALVAGGPVDDVRIGVPAVWGPTRRTWLRRAARQAGLGQPTLIETPAAAASWLTRDTPPPDGALLLIIDVGAGTEATVLRRTGGGFEVLAPLADPDAGGDRVDTRLLEALGITVEDLPGAQRWSLLADARTAKQLLSEQIAVSLPMPPPAPPMVVNTMLVHQAAQPVLEHVGELAAQALTNADLSVEQLHAVHTIGAGATMAGSAELIAAKLGVVAEAAPQPDFAAVLGTAGAHSGTTPAIDPTAPTAAESRFPPLPRLLTMAVPGLASLLLYTHFAFSAEFNNGTPGSRREHYWVMAAWGELAMASILLCLTCLRAAGLFVAVLQHADPPAPGAPARSRIAAGITLAATTALACAGLYAVTAAVYMAQPVAGPMRWAVLPILPTVTCALALAVLAWRRRTTTPAAGWDTFLAFPLSSVAAAAVGTYTVCLWWDGPMPVWLNGWGKQAGQAGGLLIGIAIACALVRHPIARLVLAALLGLFSLIIAGGNGVGILSIIYALAVATWWAVRVWAFSRIPTPGHGT